MRHLKLTIAYDGTDYVGWQVQKNGIAVQQRLEEAWQAVTGEKIRITASGRTDSGVHALAQVCSLQTESRLDAERLTFALNANVPEDIVVLRTEEAPAGFHAIRDAVSKTYRYNLQFGTKCDVLQRRFQWYVPGRLDVDAMKQGAKFLVGTHDFASFQAVGADRPHTVRTVSQLDLEHRRTEHFDYLEFTISADGFLYNMVRNIVGTLMRVGQGTHPAEWVGWVLAQQDRRVAGQTAPPEGLFLIRVVYDAAAA